MAKQLSQRQLLAVRTDNLSDAELQEVLDFITILESRRLPRTVGTAHEDELVSLLANATENRRARQAFEWETVRKQTERRAAANIGRV